MAAVAGAAVAAWGFTANAAQSPNIVHIMVDDLGWQDVACYYRTQHDNEPFYETPNLDRMAKGGIRFTKAYSPAMTCAPSRAAYMTGQFTPHNGVYHVNMGGRIPRTRKDDRAQIDPYYTTRIMPGKPVIGLAMKNAGYTTAHVGKWHVSGTSYSPAPIQVGFDFSFGKDKHYNDPEIYDIDDPKQRNFSGLYKQAKHRLKTAFNDPLFPLLEDDRPYDSMTDLSQRWIEKVSKKDKPFFLNLCPSLVHGPIMTRDKKRLAHYCKKLGIPFPTDQGSISDPDKPGQHNPYYASMVDSVDWIVGQMIKTLEETDDARNPGHKLIENTYVFVSSDNGAAQSLMNWKGDKNGQKTVEKVSDNSPLREGKGWAYEGGIRIPFIAIGPGIKPGTVNNQTVVNLIDLFPTFMSIGGLENDGSLDIDGCNILPVLKGEEQVARFHDGTERDTIYHHYPVLRGAFSVIQRGGWKLMKNTGVHMNTAPEIQLFNLSDDLGEAKNLAEQHPEKARVLLADLDAWLTKYNAGVPYNNAEYAAGNLPGQKNVPKATGLGYDNGKLWATFEAGKGKSKIAEAYFLYTVNGDIRTADEEWFRAPAKLSDGRVEAEPIPGMTHGIFCLLDENNFLIYSEKVPTMQKIGLFKALGYTLNDGYAYKPGLVSLIDLCESALSGLKSKGQNTVALEKAVQAAKGSCSQPVVEKVYAPAIRSLRSELVKFKGIVPEADKTYLHFFSDDKHLN